MRAGLAARNRSNGGRVPNSAISATTRSSFFSRFWATIARTSCVKARGLPFHRRDVVGVGAAIDAASPEVRMRLDGRLEAVAEALPAALDRRLIVGPNPEQGGVRRLVQQVEPILVVRERPVDRAELALREVLARIVDRRALRRLVRRRDALVRSRRARRRGPLGRAHTAAVVVTHEHLCDRVIPGRALQAQDAGRRTKRGAGSCTSVRRTEWPSRHTLALARVDIAFRHPPSVPNSGGLSTAIGFSPSTAIFSDWVGAGLTPAPPTPPDVRVRIRRFAQHSRKRR